VEEAGTVGPPGEVIKIRPLIGSSSASPEWRPATKSGVDTPLVPLSGTAHVGLLYLAMIIGALLGAACWRIVRRRHERAVRVRNVR
jgi:hypothetical protein